MSLNIIEYVEDICGILIISLPKIELTSEDIMGSQTCLAAANPEKWSIVIKENSRPADMIFATAHELRHLWQSKHGYGLQDVKQSINVSKREYNLQPHEIDANAFGVCYMKLFGIKPLFNGLDEDVKQMIYNRAIEIENNINTL